jgi:hypothetical protein
MCGAMPFSSTSQFSTGAAPNFVEFGGICDWREYLPWLLTYVGLDHLNSRIINCIFGGPTDTIGMNKFGTFTLGCASTVALEAFPHPAKTGCRWHVSRCLRARVSRK